MFDLDAAGLSALAGMLVSLLFGYGPWIKDWFESLNPKVKPLLNIAVLLVVAWGYTAIKCNFDLNCLGANASVVFGTWFTAVVANMVTYTGVVRQFTKTAKQIRQA